MQWTRRQPLDDRKYADDDQRKNHQNDDQSGHSVNGMSGGEQRRAVIRSKCRRGRNLPLSSVIDSGQLVDDGSGFEYLPGQTAYLLAASH
jgi:hypothetical protein